MAQWKRRSSSNSTMAMAVAAVVLTALTMGANAAVHGHMDLCKSYTRVCNDFTSQVGLAGWRMLVGRRFLVDLSPPGRASLH